MARAYQRGKLLFAQLAIGKLRSERAQPTPAGKGQRGGARLRLGRGRKVDRLAVHPRMMQRLRHAARAIAAPQQVLRARLRESLVVDVTQLDEAGDEGIHLRFILVGPSPLANLALQIMLELRRSGGVAARITQREIAQNGVVERFGGPASAA